MRKGEPIVVVKYVSKSYGKVEALKEVSLVVGCTLYKQPVSGGSGQAIENIKICGCRDIGFANTHCLDL